MIWREVETQRTWCNMAFLSSSSSAITSGLSLLFYFTFSPLFGSPYSSLCVTCTFGNKTREPGRQVGRDQMPALLTLILFSWYLDPSEGSFALVTFGRSRPLLLCQHKGVRCSAFYGKKPSLGLSKISAFSGAEQYKRFKGGNC